MVYYWVYPLVMTNILKRPIEIDYLTIKQGDFPVPYVKLPKGTTFVVFFSRRMNAMDLLETSWPARHPLMRPWVNVDHAGERLNNSRDYPHLATPKRLKSEIPLRTCGKIEHGHLLGGTLGKPWLSR